MVQPVINCNGTSFSRNQNDNKSAVGSNEKSNNNTKAFTNSQHISNNVNKNNLFGSTLRNETYFKALHNY